MKLELILFLTVLCAFASAMVPREKREVSGKQECAQFTPCAWTPYHEKTKEKLTTLFNDYCVCAEGKDCLIFSDDTPVNTYVHRCVREGEAKEIEES